MATGLRWLQSPPLPIISEDFLLLFKLPQGEEEEKKRLLGRLALTADLVKRNIINFMTVSRARRLQNGFF